MKINEWYVAAGITLVIWLILPEMTKLQTLVLVASSMVNSALLVCGVEDWVERIRRKIRKRKAREAWKVRPELADIRILK